MTASTPYIEQVRLLVAVLPSVAKQKCFALKGGTATNLFVRNLPRLSVDIDLAYLPVEDRDASLAAIESGVEPSWMNGYQGFRTKTGPYFGLKTMFSRSKRAV